MRNRTTWRCLALATAAALATCGTNPVLARAGTTRPPIERIAIADHVSEASRRFGIPEAWIYAVIRIESGGRTRAVSPAGARGLMQLMPGTWARQRARLRLGNDPFDPRDNILAGTSYLREMLDRYGVAGFLAAYNAGPGRYEQWRDAGRSLPLETRRYIATFARLLQRERSADVVGAAPDMLSMDDRETSQSHARRADLAQACGSSANRFACPSRAQHDLFVVVSSADPQ